MYSRQRARSWTPTARPRGRRANAARTVDAAAAIARRSAAIAMSRPRSVLPPAKPGNHLLGVLVRRKHRIEHLRDDAVVDDESHALEQRHAGGCEGRQLDRTRQFQTLVGQDAERQVQTLRRFTLVAGVLRRQAIDLGHAELLEFGEVVAERA